MGPMMRGIMVLGYKYNYGESGRDLEISLSAYYTNYTSKQH